ncbi:MAG: stage II sporulation protein P, partial [Oscillospiraceae bacterium]|nr:stage II sporulation protein P [Oscillospiraceae bacterium]
MSVFKKALSFLTVVAITALSFKVVSLPSVSAAATSFACMSAMLLMPEGAKDIICAKYENPVVVEESQEVLENEVGQGELSNSEITDSSDSGNSGNDATTQTSASVDNMVGSIIEKSFSPYTANTAYNNIYINNKTGVDIDIGSELSANLELKLDRSDSPQVLIYHTHATESFMPEDRDYYIDSDLSRSTDDTKNMVAVGNVLAQKLEEAGFVVKHDATQHDYPSYTGSYTRSAETINKYLSEYPSIKIIIDLHRDAISSGNTDKVAPIIEINGKKAAQV